MVDGEHDLSVLLATMRPELQPGTFVFVSLADEGGAHGLHPLATFREAEGLSMIVEQSQADRAGLAYGPVMRCITLTVHSSLEAVGLTAAVSTALADCGISANMVAATRHDHVFVPEADAERALLVLAAAFPEV